MTDEVLEVDAFPAPIDTPIAAAAGTSRRLAVTPATVTWAVIGLGFAFALFLRFWHLSTLGYNSDEAVYAGQAAAIANDHVLQPFFPLFRAHPLLFQTIDSLGYQLGAGELFGRIVSGVFGLGTIALVFATGRLLYGRKVGALAAVIVALMPYDVLVSRQVLLDGPAAFFATGALYLLARFSISRDRTWLFAAAATLGLAVLTKETSILLVGAIYAFIALSPEVGVRVRDALLGLLALLAVVTAYPLTLRLAGHSHTGQHYLAYQLFRRPNHSWLFYPTVVPLAIGVLVVCAALLGLWLLRRQVSWRETLLLSWIAVPALFFQLYPVKGFQYLLPIAPALAILAARMLGRWHPASVSLPRLRRSIAGVWITPVLTAVVLVSLAIPTWLRVNPSSSQTFLAGSGGLPGGRDAGLWINRHVPKGAEILAIGPSMANVVEFYGHRRTFVLSVGTNPLRRNPAYEPLRNPDFSIRENDVQYLVWDGFSAARTPFFSNKLLEYARRYNGRIVHTESVGVKSAGGHLVRKPLIVIYEVRP